ncbi:MAG: hypothetical protein L0Y57_01910 [Beijerinckiaceae bacterium]|nr:hypothetical protein [Beijerinckiaceae bacterium]
MCKCFAPDPVTRKTIEAFRAHSSPDGFLVHSFAGDDALSCKDYVRAKLGLPAFKAAQHATDRTLANTKRYDYCNSRGEPIYSKERFEYSDGSKSFAIKPQGRNGSAPLLYGAERLAGLPEGQPVWIVEGEAKVDRLRELGAVGVCCDSGSNSKWLPSHAELLRGLPVILWPDSDEPGEKYVAAAADAVRKDNHGADIRIVRPFGPPNGTKGLDVCDWQGDDAALVRVAGSATPYPVPVASEGEDVRDPLEGLVERNAADAGAAFARDVLERLAALKRDNRAAFEALRAQLKKAGCRVTALDDAIAEESGEAGGRGPTQADILIDLAQSAELFHAPDGTGFAGLDINGHRETWPIRAKGFRRWIARRFFEATGGAPSSEALQSALNVIEAKAHFDAPEHTVHVRIGGLDERLYLDLGDETWRAVEIDAAGWRVIDNPPVRFRRAAGMQHCRSRLRAARSRRCDSSSMSVPTPISCW